MSEEEGDDACSVISGAYTVISAMESGVVASGPVYCRLCINASNDAVVLQEPLHTVCFEFA
jgi:hypothetical protein